MEHNKAAGTNAIPIEFLQTCWEIIEEDIIQMFDDLHKGMLDVSRLNYGIITLLPKVSDASKIQQVHPICLLNCLYKWITKVLTITLAPFAGKNLCKEQTTFMKGRNIMSRVMALHEILHETKRRKKTWVILKLDFEKAYGMVAWSFLLESFQKRGFNAKWWGWIHQVVSSGTVSVKLNNKTSPYFVSHKGVRQGDLLSPLLFSFVIDCLTRMIKKPKETV
jgi:hypothetical protein